MIIIVHYGIQPSIICVDSHFSYKERVNDKRIVQPFPRGFWNPLSCLSSTSARKKYWKLTMWPSNLFRKIETVDYDVNNKCRHIDRFSIFWSRRRLKYPSKITWSLKQFTSLSVCPLMKEGLEVQHFQIKQRWDLNGDGEKLTYWVSVLAWS